MTRETKMDYKVREKLFEKCNVRQHKGLMEDIDLGGSLEMFSEEYVLVDTV